MRTIQKFNKIAFYTTSVLYLTIYLGLYAQIALGFIQICIAFYITSNKIAKNRKLKNRMVNYWIYVGLYTLLFTFFFNNNLKINHPFLLLIVVIIIPMSLAIYFNITLNKIVNQDEEK